jgi:hypothetical protein
MNTDTKVKRRGPGKNPALVHLSVRLPMEVVQYLNANYPYTKQAKVREILTNYVKQNGV